jgi:hypothetical protein
MSRDHTTQESAILGSDEASSSSAHKAPGRSNPCQDRYGGLGCPLGETEKSAMETSFGRSFSNVRVYEDSPQASASGVHAVTVGSDIHFAPGAFNPHEPSGRFLLGHELAHVVQQGGAQVGRQAKADADVMKTGTGYLEAEADRVGHSVAAGESVAGTILGRLEGPTRQHFDASEHMAIGDAATGGPRGETQMVELAPDYRVTFGEMNAMAGDYFGSIGEMRTLAANDGKGEGTREEIEYVRVVKVHDNKSAKDRFGEAARAAADRRYYRLAGKNYAHFVNPGVGDTDRPTADKATDTVPDVVLEREEGELWGRLRAIEVPGNAIAGYRSGHLTALTQALSAGERASKGEPSSIESALASEAFAQHFLNDAFAGGHMRAPRIGALDYWNAKVPLFFHNFKLYLAEVLAKYINDNTTWQAIASVDYIWGEARTALRENLEN